MTTNQPLSLFISSKMTELQEERHAVQKALAAYHIYGWLWEKDAGARPESIQSTYLKEVEACDIYLGLFWKGYGQYTLEEYWHARNHNKPCLIYEKRAGIEQRDPQLTDFLQKINHVSDGLTVYHFERSEELAEQVQRDIIQLLTSKFRNTRQQPIWNIPFARNPFFTGRDELLELLHTQLQTIQTETLSQPQAISGLGGIGKTQLAIEYAYRYRQEYQAVLWARADTTEALNASYTEIAALLQLPQKEAQDQEVIVQAVKDWLRTKRNWLLILDNADDLNILQSFLPTEYPGHLFLTTRSQVTEIIAKRLEVETMSWEAGALLLLRRAGLITPDLSLESASSSNIALARAITEELGGLPLALDQAGAYIEETACGMESYQQEFRAERARMLARRGRMILYHPESVATTWSLSFAKIEVANPTAAELLRICAFLAPDAIPEELLIETLKLPLPDLEGKERQGRGWGSWFSRLPSLHRGRPKKPLQSEVSWNINEAVAVLRAYSLIQKKREEQTFSVHRLVQAVLRDAMEEREFAAWIIRVVRAVDALFPAVEFRTWGQCTRYLPHALVCGTWIQDKKLILLEGASLLNRAGWYLTNRSQYKEAEPLYKQALAIREQQLGTMHPEVASSLNSLAALYDAQGKYKEAEPLYKQALAIREQQLGVMHPEVANILSNLASLYFDHGRYAEAMPLFQRALQIWGPEHPNATHTLHNLACLYAIEGKYTEAEPLFQRVLEIWEKQLEPEDPLIAYTLSNLGETYAKQRKYEEAESLYQRAMRISEEQLGLEHPLVANLLKNQALLSMEQGKFVEAELLFQQALRIWEEQLGPEHYLVAHPLTGLAELYQGQGKYPEAEPFYERALHIREKALEQNHPDTAEALHGFAVNCEARGDTQKAVSLYQRALVIHEQFFGLYHSTTTKTREHLRRILVALGADEEAARLANTQPEIGKVAELEDREI